MGEFNYYSKLHNHGFTPTCMMSYRIFNLGRTTNGGVYLLYFHIVMCSFFYFQFLITGKIIWYIICTVN